MMRKLVSLLLCIAVMLALCGLAGCGAKKPLRVLVDLTRGGAVAEYENSMRMLLTELQFAGGPEDVELEFLPQDDAERSAAVTRLRTEMMAGKGPDVFIMNYLTGPDPDLKGDTELTVLSPFLMPEKSMELGLFLPLDDYMEKAQFMEPDKMVPSILAAGRTERWGQVLLPLGYTFELTYCLAADVPAPQRVTWEEMAAGQPLMQAAVTPPQYGARGAEYLSDTFGSLVDYKEKSLLFTEEALLERINSLIDLEQRRDRGAFAGAADHFRYQACMNFELQNIGVERMSDEITQWQGLSYIPDLAEDIYMRTEQPVTMVPAYNDDGGVTATVYTWAAINANTKRAEDAFFILDYLFDRDGMSASGMMSNLLSSTGCVPVYEDFMSDDRPVYFGASPYGPYYWSMTDENFSEFCRVREQITTVKLAGTLELELSLLYQDCKAAAPADRADLVHKTYSRMQKEISE